MTGTLFAPELKAAIERLNARFGTRLAVVGVENRYFGGDVSVAGLLTGECYAAARDSLRGEFAVIPAASLKSGGEAVMLDGTTPAELERRLGLPVRALDFASFAEAVGDGV